MQCVSRMTPDDSEHMRERYERAEARIESARDRFERARAVDRLYDRSWRNSYAAFRAGEVSEFGLYGREPDAMEAANMYLRAHRLGDTRATWKLILGHPLSSTPGEASGRAWRLFMEAAAERRVELASALSRLRPGSRTTRVPRDSDGGEDPWNEPRRGCSDGLTRKCVMAFFSSIKPEN